MTLQPSNWRRYWRDHGLKLAFLCSCQTAITGPTAFSGVAQLLLHSDGGDIPAVVAMQAALPVRRSAELAAGFYRLAAETRNLAQALSQARRDAYDNGDTAWCIPVLYCRRQPFAMTAPAATTELPDRSMVYMTRGELESVILGALKKHRFVSVEGLPGIGKTQVGLEVARLARGDGLFDRVIFIKASLAYTTVEVRATISTALGQTDISDDAALAAAIEDSGERILLLLDNAEDLLMDDEMEQSLRDQVQGLFDKTSSLHIMLTTRWGIDGVEPRPRVVRVPPMSRPDVSELLRRELDSIGVLDEEWLESDDWNELIDLIDGHPRSLSLVVGHVAVWCSNRGSSRGATETPRPSTRRAGAAGQGGQVRFPAEGRSATASQPLGLHRHLV